MESCTAGHTHRALDRPTQLYRGAVWLDQAANLRHSTSSTHEGTFWCVVTAIRCSYRLTGVFLPRSYSIGTISQEYKLSVNAQQHTVINIELLIDSTNSKQSNCWISLSLVHSGNQLAKYRTYRYLYRSLVTNSVRRAGTAPYVCN